jgi:hypothetical protein
MTLEDRGDGQPQEAWTKVDADNLRHQGIIATLYFFKPIKWGGYMKHIFLLVDGDARVTLADFIEVNSEENDCTPIEDSDIKAIENLTHFIPSMDRGTIRAGGYLFEHVASIVRTQ